MTGMQNAVVVAGGMIGSNNGSIQAQDTSVYTAAALQHCRYTSVLVLCQFYFEPETRSAADD